jgi:hypothetical protein
MKKLIAKWDEELDYVYNEQIRQRYLFLGEKVIIGDRKKRIIKAFYLAVKDNETIGLIRIWDLKKGYNMLYEVQNKVEVRIC